MISRPIRMFVLGIYLVSLKSSFCLSGCQAFVSTRSAFFEASLWHTLRYRRSSDFVYSDKRGSTVSSLYGESKDDNDNDMKQSSKTRLALPALGPAGTSSNTKNHEIDSMDDLRDSTEAAATTTIDKDGRNQDTHSVANFVNPKFALQYTCKVCNTKNRVVVSRQAYREGMVIVVCKGCDNKHWIADNLDPTLSHSNIEEYLESCGKGDTVNRVTEEVYEIERVWGLKEGEITDESGDAVLE